MKENQIKVGDIVRVSKDAPKMYLRGFDHIFTGVESVVSEVEDDNAVIIFNTDHINSQTTIPTKYLVKVDAEAKEPKFKKGDKVRFKKVYTVVSVDDGQVFIDSAGNHIDEDYLELYTEPTAPTIKAGDIIDTPKGKGIVRISDGDYWVAQLDNGEWYIHMESNMSYAPCTEPKEQPEAEKQAFALGERVVTPYGCGVIGKDIEGKVAVVLESGGYCGIDNANKIFTEKTDTDWNTYTADLAKDIAVKITNKKMESDPEEVGSYAVAVAESVVENLKKNNPCE